MPDVVALTDGPGAQEKTPQLVAIKDFLIDCSLSEDHNFESEVTEFPVESGSNITDNIRPKPVTVKIEGIVTNTPIGYLDTIRGPNSQAVALGQALTFGLVSTSPVDTLYALFQKIREDREPVTIRTSLRTFENMALKSLNLPRDASTGDALRFTAEFIQIQIVTNKRPPRVSTPIASKHKKLSQAPGKIIKFRTILIDPGKGMWFDPDIEQWRHTATFKTTGKFDETTGKASRVSKWHLYRSMVEIADPFESLEIHGSHPYPKLLAVSILQCEEHGFKIKNDKDIVYVKRNPSFAGASASATGGV